MNTIALYFDKYENGVAFSSHGLLFENVNVVRMLIDGVDIYEIDIGFEDALVFFEELSESARGSGCYLIFTCACGIAEDGGWEGVDVVAEGGYISWNFYVGGRQLKYSFRLDQYVSELESVREILNLSRNSVAPVQVIFPPDFQR
jgi:hypothetical protein